MRTSAFCTSSTQATWRPSTTGSGADDILEKMSFIHIDSNMVPYISPEEYDEYHEEYVKSGKKVWESTDVWKQRYTFSGKYGANLMEEVARYAVVAAQVARDLEGQFDVIHAHDWLTYYAGIAAKRVSGKPLVVHMHATEFDRSGENINTQVYAIERAGMMAADRVIAVSNLTRNIVITRYGIPADKVVTVHNAVRFAENNTEAPERGVKDKIVTFLGRITYQKGPDYFVEAAAKVLKRVPDVRFVMAGSGDMMNHVIRRVARLGIADRFHFTGFLRGEDVHKMFQLSDVYIMPSVSEPFGISPLEAMRSNVPVIISKQSGVAEVLDYAIKVDYWDVDAMADAIYALLCNGRNWLADRGDVTLILGHERLRTTDASACPLQGLGYIKETYEEGNAALKARTLEVEKHDEGMAWGAVYAQYLSPVADVRAQSTGLSIEKQCFVERKTAFGRSELHPLEKEGGLRVGDKLVIRLVLRLDRAMDYVQLKDSRAACLEPTATLSGYRWTGGFGYYAETKDASTRFFFDHLGKGTYVLEYSCRVSQVGTYQSGLATVQCAYAPEMAAHSSAGTPLQVKE